MPTLRVLARRIGLLRPPAAIAGLLCLSASVLLVVSSIGDSRSDASAADGLPVGEPNPADLAAPTLCDDVAKAVAAKSGLEAALARLELPTDLSASLVEQLGPVATVRCFTDSLAGSVVVAIDGPGQASGVVLSNSSEYRAQLLDVIGYATTESDDSGTLAVSDGLIAEAGAGDRVGMDALLIPAVRNQGVER
jgi:hypothetical protein